MIGRPVRGNWICGHCFRTLFAPTITAEAALAGVVQNPICTPFGLAAAAKRLPILDLPPEQSSDFSISLLPPEATPAVETLRLSIQIPVRGTSLPQIGKQLDNPSVCKGPTGAEIIAYCRTRPRAAWRAINSPQRVTLGSEPSVIAFKFEQSLPMPPSGPFDTFNIRVSGPDGAPAFPMTDADYDNIAVSNGLSVLPAGVSFEHHENGPDIGFDAGIAPALDLAKSSARAWLGAIRSHLSGTDLTATLYPPGIDPIGRSPNVRFEMADGGAIGLAGFLVEMPAVSLTAVGDSAPTLLRSLAEIERHPMEWAEAGAYRVTIELPWGR